MYPACPRCTQSMRLVSESAGSPKVERYYCDKCKVWARIELAYHYDEPASAQETGTEPDAWLIVKNGYYYRPNRAGYTSSIEDAGRYTEAEAKTEAAIEPSIMRAIPLSEAEFIGRKEHP